MFVILLIPFLVYFLFRFEQVLLSKFVVDLRSRFGLMSENDFSTEKIKRVREYLIKPANELV